MEPKEPKHNKPRQGIVSSEGLWPDTYKGDAVKNTAFLGHILRDTQQAFLIGDDWYKGPDSPGTDLDAGIYWLAESLKRAAGMKMTDYHQLYGSDILHILQLDRANYNPAALGKKKKDIMERVHFIQESYAMQLISPEDPERFARLFAVISGLTGSVESFHMTKFIKTSYRIAARLLGDTKILNQEGKSVIYPEEEHYTKAILPLVHDLGEPFGSYRDALLYKLAWAHMQTVLVRMRDGGFINYDDFVDIAFTCLSFMEVMLEEKKHIGVGVNAFEDHKSYINPLADKMEKVLERLSEVKTNILPGGSEEKSIDYDVHIAKGMRLHDLWGVTAVRVVGKHPTPITDTSPLFLHIALERVEGHAPIYAYYNIRTEMLVLLYPDSVGYGGTAELHLHLYSLITDLRHYERRGISIQKEGEEYHPAKGERMKIPIKRSFVIGKQGIIEEPKPEPTGTVYVTPRKATLPYGSQLVAALSKLEQAQGAKDQIAISKAQAEVDRLKKHLPAASDKNIEKYRKKAEALGLDPGLIVVREGRITEAPREGFDQPIFTPNPPQKREIRVIPSFGCQFLRVNELFSAPDNVDVVFSDEEEQQTTKEQSIEVEEAQEDLPPQTTWRRLMKRFDFSRRDAPPNTG